ncbi:MAG TPA: methionine--tRNA ligase [Clostridiales bacterium]|nr:methionine--tRNA ligase [Clostridiales bacterium]
MKEKFYITTPIYYPSGHWHIGHCYTTVICDAIARYQKMLGKDVFFLTGTDEHGQKIEKKAAALGKTPMEFINPLVDELKSVWAALDVKYDKFIRTTDDYHVKAVQKIFKELYDKGEIYKAEYKGWYCTPCESFWTDAQLKDGKCPDCGRPVTMEKEESYFFRLSKYTDKIIQLYKDNPEFLQPKSRVNEMINNFLKPGLQDLCVSRTSIKWGVPVTFDEKHTVYVWVDALTNYITALGYGSDDDSLFKKYWPADLHLMGKEIIRFHSIIWPAILMALDLPLPKQVYGHGWLLIGGDKLSKSKEDKVKFELTDPHQLVNRYGTDALRYFLLREIPFGSDGVYTNESLIGRINADLANNLGNLVSRTTAMINQYFGGVLPEPGEKADVDDSLIETAESLFDKVDSAMRALNAPEALTAIFGLIGRANKYIDETTPWLLDKDETKRERLKTVMYNLAESIRIAAIFLKPFTPRCPNVILDAFGIDGEKITDFETVKKFGYLRGGAAVKKIPPVFPRLDLNKENEEIKKIVMENQQKSNEAATVAAAPAAKPEVKLHSHAAKPEIDIEEFGKVELKIAKVIAAEKVEKSKKLLKLTVKVGDETRTVVSGIAHAYSPEYLVGKKLTMVTNLKPVKLCGILSEGMIVCAEDEEGKIAFLSPENDIADGSMVF